ncbi:FecR family protein [Pleomorphovibrio marinus]|uniref:FecR family protein n=1 Tax=Pleomorphovibrio marinus TaxID=2164132 RepID=UPI000E0B7602|nr:FecR family protein [Pleomorphovibrio marinus]
MRNFKLYWKKFFKGELTSEEAYFFMDWFHSNKGKKAFDSMIEEAYKEETDVASEWDGERLLQETLKKKEAKKGGNFLRYPKIYLGEFIKYAAVVIFSIGFSYFLIGYDNDSTMEVESKSEEVSPKLLTRQNPKGQKSRIVLPDSTVVFLNADSELSYLEGFSQGREVKLRGEAFFEIAKDSLNPFVVKSGRLSTTALGTSFNVQAYEEDPAVKVTLATGKVSVEDKLSNKVLLMDPGEATLVKMEDHEPRKVHSDPKVTSLWKDGILHFDKTPLNEVIPTLERWYGVKIEVSGKLPNHKCTGTFKKNEYLSNVLRVLGHNVGFNYIIKGKEVFIYLKP